MNTASFKPHASTIDKNLF